MKANARRDLLEFDGAGKIIPKDSFWTVLE